MIDSEYHPQHQQFICPPSCSAISTTSTHQKVSDPLEGGEEMELKLEILRDDDSNLQKTGLVVQDDDPINVSGDEGDVNLQVLTFPEPPVRNQTVFDSCQQNFQCHLDPGDPNTTALLEQSSFRDTHLAVPDSDLESSVLIDCVQSLSKEKVDERNTNDDNLASFSLRNLCGPNPRLITVTIAVFVLVWISVVLGIHSQKKVTSLTAKISSLSSELADLQELYLRVKSESERKSQIINNLKSSSGFSSIVHEEQVNNEI